MKKKSGGLGKGLSALIPQEDVDGVFSENNEHDIKKVDRETLSTKSKDITKTLCNLNMNPGHNLDVPR